MDDLLDKYKKQTTLSTEQLVAFVSMLRTEQHGCPWAREQSFKSLLQYTMAEHHELIAALRQGEPQHLCEELGDNLLQLIFYAVIASEQGSFNWQDVTVTLWEKLQQRMPHIFAGKDCATAQQAAQYWTAAKAQNKTKPQDKIVNSNAPQTPLLTVDIIIRLVDRSEQPILLIKRLHPPHGYALPGGFVDIGETTEHAAQREALEETGLCINNLKLLGVYSAPTRDPRGHSVTVSYVADASGEPCAGDDAAAVIIVDPQHIQQNLAFDHEHIIADYATSL